MAIVDDRPPTSRRVNTIDLVVLMVALILVPAAYGGYLLFRSPQPKLLGISPSTLHQGKQLTVEIQGRDLRPFMRVSFNDMQGRTFLIGSTKSALVDLPDLPAGTYDVVLYDYRQEVDRLPKALTILPLAPTPLVELDLGGSFIGLTAAGAAEIKAGVRFPPTGVPTSEVLNVGVPVPGHLRMRAGDVPLNVPLNGDELPAMLRVQCNVTSNADGSLGCIVYGPDQAAPIARGSALTLVGPHGWLRFQIADIHLATTLPMSRAQVRFVVTDAQFARMKPGDVDRGPETSSGAAKFLTLGTARAIPQPTSNGPGLVRAVDVTLQVPVDRVVEGWTYKQAPFKVGAPFTFETDQYIVHGEVIDMSVPPAAGRSPGKQ
jgi:hypothetical protein